MAFLHQPSKTFIQADLMFNMPATEQVLSPLSLDLRSFHSPYLVWLCARPPSIPNPGSPAAYLSVSET